MKRPAIVSDTIALKATDDAMLMTQMMAVKRAQNMTAFNGIAERSWTWDV